MPRCGAALTRCCAKAPSATALRAFLWALLLAGCAAWRPQGAALVWRVPADAPQPAGLGAVAAPAVHEKTVLVGGQDGFLHWIRLTDGHEFRRKALRGPVEVGPVYADGLWIVADEAGEVLALDTHAHVRWRVQERAPVVALRCAGRRCVLVTADGRVRALDTQGRTQWIWADPKGAGLMERVLAPPQWAQDHWLVALPSGDLAALRADEGTLLWRVQAADNRGVVRISELKALVGAFARLADDWVVPVAGGELLWLAPDGRIVRKRALAARANVLVQQKQVWVGAEDGALYLLDAASGRTLWKLKLDEAALVGLVPGADCTWAVSATGLVACVDEEGHVRARVRLPEPVAAPPVADGQGGVLVLDRTGGLARITQR